MAITLFLVRTPNRPFDYGGLAGRFGKLLALSGPEVTAASLVEDADADQPDTVAVLPDERRAIRLTSDGAAIDEVKRYTTIERMGGYVQLRPNCGTWRVMKQGAYTVRVQRGNSAVQHLYQGKDRQGHWVGTPIHNGDCLRIEGAVSQPEMGILIHEAPNVSWLTGCISPRDFNNFRVALTSRPNTNESYTAMTELFQFLGEDTANFFVMDW